MALGHPRFDPRQQQRGYQIRVNHRIRVPEVRVIDADGSMLGVLQTHEALRMAQEQGLDLVEVNPKAEPPVCKILDFGKYKYEEKKKQAQARRNQSVVEIKEIKLRPKTDDHDIAFKVKAARRFLEAGHKVKFTVRFRGREITHPEKAHEQLDIILKALEDVANIETRPDDGGARDVASSSRRSRPSCSGSRSSAPRKRRRASKPRRRASPSRRSRPRPSCRTTTAMTTMTTTTRTTTRVAKLAKPATARVPTDGAPRAACAPRRGA